jgi:hypothetical protein
VNDTVEKAKALSKDYGLTDSDDIRTHFQQFLRHIGQGMSALLTTHPANSRSVGTSVDVVIPSDSMIDPEELDN